MMYSLDVWTAVFENMEKEYGDVAGYVKSQLGFTDEDVRKIRRNLRDE